MGNINIKGKVLNKLKENGSSLAVPAVAGGIIFAPVLIPAGGLAVATVAPIKLLAGAYKRRKIAQQVRPLNLAGVKMAYTVEIDYSGNSAIVTVVSKSSEDSSHADLGKIQLPVEIFNNYFYITIKNTEGIEDDPIVQDLLRRDAKSKELMTFYHSQNVYRLSRFSKLFSKAAYEEAKPELQSLQMKLTHALRIGYEYGFCGECELLNAENQLFVRDPQEYGKSIKVSQNDGSILKSSLSGDKIDETKIAVYFNNGNNKPDLAHPYIVDRQQFYGILKQAKQ